MRARNPGPPALLDALAERYIIEAAARGAFDDLPGAGAPLPPEDLDLVPEELRAGYRLLKNSGYLPSELLPCAELKEIERLLARAGSGEERHGLLVRMNFLLSRRAGETRNLRVDEDYFVRVVERLGGDLDLHNVRILPCRAECTASVTNAVLERAALIPFLASPAHFQNR